MVNMERSERNTTTHLNQSYLSNGIEGLNQESELTWTNISLGFGFCTIIINVVTMGLLLRHRKCMEGTGFLQQLVFLCSTDILTGLSIVVPPLSYVFFDFYANMYYLFCAIGIFLVPLSSTLSSGNCCIISIYRYVILRYIDKPNTIWHKYSSLLMLLCNGVFCIVIISLSVFAVRFHFGLNVKEFCEKMNMPGQNEYKSIFLMGILIIKILFLLGTNVLTILSIVKIRKLNRSQSASITSSQLLNIIKRNRYATVTFVLIVFVLNLATLPTLLFVLVLKMEKVTVSADTTEVMGRLLCMNSLLNPFIYSLRSRELHIAVINDIRAVLSRIRCSHNAP